MRRTITLSKIPTGIQILDKRLGGGLPAGSMVCVYANPISMPEVFLHQFATVYKTYYFTTVRPSQYVKENIENLGFDVDNIEFVDVFSMYYISDTGAFIVDHTYRNKEIFDFVDEKISQINERNAILIFDNLSFFFKTQSSIRIERMAFKQDLCYYKKPQGVGLLLYDKKHPSQGY